MHCCENRIEPKDKGAPVDPVCGIKVEDADPKLVADYHGRKYYFCAQACMQQFQQQPERCLEPRRRARTKKKGLWGRYLERLNKATGGKAIKCH